MLQAEELAMKKNEANLQALKDTMFRQSQQLFGLRQEEANLIAEISGAQAASRNLQSKIRQLDQESMRQQELIYNAEFQIQQMERKVARGLGERSDEEKKKLNAQISVLEAEVEGAKDKRKMLIAQCRKLNNELRGAVRKKEDSIKLQVRGAKRALPRRPQPQPQPRPQPTHPPAPPTPHPFALHSTPVTPHQALACTSPFHPQTPKPAHYRRSWARASASSSSRTRARSRTSRRCRPRRSSSWCRTTSCASSSSASATRSTRGRTRFSGERGRPAYLHRVPAPPCPLAPTPPNGHTRGRLGQAG